MSATFCCRISCGIEIPYQDSSFSNVGPEMFDEMFFDKFLAILKWRSGVSPSSNVVKDLVPELSWDEIQGWNRPVRREDHKVLL